MNIFVGGQADRTKRNNLFYVDVTKQYDKIMEFIAIYKEAYGFPNIEGIWDHILTHNAFRNAQLDMLKLLS